MGCIGLKLSEQERKELLKRTFRVGGPTEIITSGLALGPPTGIIKNISEKATSMPLLKSIATGIFSTAKNLIKSPTKIVTKLAGTPAAKVVAKPIAKQTFKAASPLSPLARKVVPLKALSTMKFTTVKPLPGTGGILKPAPQGILKKAVGTLGSAKGQFDKLPLAKKIAVAGGSVAAVGGAIIAAKAAADSFGISKAVTGLFRKPRRKTTKRKKKAGGVKRARRKSKSRRTKSRRRSSRRTSRNKKSSKRVSFTTRDGRRVSFTPRGKRRAKRSRRSILADRRQVSKQPWEQSYRRKT